MFDIVTLSSSSTGFLIIALNDRRVSPLGYWPYSAVSFARDVSCVDDCLGEPKGAITSKIKHAIKLKTSPARLAQLLQPSAFYFIL